MRSHTSRLAFGAVLALGVASLLIAKPASALQPLRDFVNAARNDNNDNRKALAQKAQAAADASVAFGKALPSVDVRGIYAHSQLQPQFPGADGQPAPPLVPQNIYILSAGVAVPISVGAWEKSSAANASARAADAGERNARLTVERAVTRAYYDLVGSEAVLRATRHRLDLATANAAVVRATAKEGEASNLDVERTRADVAHAEQDVADAETNILRARRQLRSASGIEPSAASDADFPADDLREEAPLDAWTHRATSSRPAIEQATESRESSEKSLAAARALWLPTVSANLTENYTNATENLGRKDFYSFFALATWHLDLSNGPSVRAAHAAVDAAKAAESQAHLDADDAVYFAWLQVQTDVKKARSARVESESAARSAELARQSFLAGASTQIDVLQSQQTYLEAEVSRIRVLADLAYAREALRLSVADGKDRR